MTIVPFMPTITVKEALIKHAAQMAHLGHPAVVERFVARNGVECIPTPFTGRRGAMGHCFENAMLYAKQNPGVRYCEGYATSHDQMAIAHGWCVDDTNAVIDPTWPDVVGRKYFGVVVETDEAWAAMVSSGYFGLLEYQCGPNLEFMFDRDPELQVIIADNMENFRNAKDTLFAACS